MFEKGQLDLAKEYVCNLFICTNWNLSQSAELRMVVTIAALE